MNSKVLFKLLFTLLTMIPLLSKSQTNPYGEVSIASPTAASLGKYADIPVSYHTGIPQINIPLYTVQAGPLSLPINLSYHASGLKVMETSSWVGAGWSLEAGGVITRTVVGQPDEKGTGCGANDLYGYFSDSGYNKYLNKDFPYEDWTGFAQGRKDGEPDLFFFNFGNYSGKFFFRDDHTPVLVPQQDIRIIPYYPSPGYSSIQGFTVITPDGTKYYFGNTPGYPGFPATAPPTEITNPYSSETGYVSGTALSSWFLNKIVSADGLFSISLQYTSENYGYYTLSSTPMDTQSPVGTHEFNLVKNILSGVRLSQINFPTGSVSFIPGQIRTDLSDNMPNNLDNSNSSATTLASVNISNNNNANSFCKKFLFYTSYFSDSITAQPDVLTTAGFNMQTDRRRLRLDSLREITCDSLLQIPARKFTYFQELLPRRITLGMDHWGFYNGVTNNQTLIPTYYTYDGVTTAPVPGANRNASWPAMRGGALQQMTYPTGGSTIFDFEPADSYVNSNAVMEPVNILSSTVHLYGQDTKYTETLPFTSNGNPVTATVFNNTRDFQASIVIKKPDGTVVYSNSSLGDNNYPTGQTLVIYPISLTAGSYTATLTIPNGPGSNEGVSVTYSQLAPVVHTFNVTIGGLRIKTITSSTTATDPTPIVTNYSYPNGAFVYSSPVYIQHVRNDVVNTLGYWDMAFGFWKNITNSAGCPIGGGFYKKGGGSLRPMATTQGYHVGYPIVKVSQTGNGYSLYNYYTTNTGFAPGTFNPTPPTIDIQQLACEASAPNYPAAPVPFDGRRGQLYYEEHHDESGQLLKTAYYYPDFDSTSQQPAPGFIVSTLSNGAMLGTYYNLVSPRQTRMHKIETDFSPGFGSVQTDTYIYSDSKYHNQQTRKVSTTSTGDSLITNTRYSADFHLSSWDVSPSCDITYKNLCAACLTRYNTGVAACNGSPTCLTDTFLLYRRCLSDARNSYVNCQFTNYTGYPTNNYKVHHDSLKNVAGAELKPILDLQDSNRIVPIEISDYRDSNLLKANFTRYDYTSGLPNIPFPNKTQLINLQSPSKTFTSSIISGITLTKDSRYLDETTYTFLKGNPARVASHDGLNTIYIWDYQNTKPIAKTISATTDTTAFSSFEADGTGNWTLSSGGGNTSQITVNVAAAGSNYNIFPIQTSSSLTQNDNQPTVGQELGMKFTSATAGMIKGIRFYKTSGNTGTHIGELYSSNGTRLAQATFTGETSTGWQTVLFSTPVSITANTTYTAAYFSSLGNFVEDDFFYMNNPVSNGPLNAPADGTDGSIGADPGNGQGTYLHTSSPAFPNQLWQAANYWVDVVFAPSTTPYANAGPNQTITLPTSSVVLNGSGSTGTISSYSWTKVSGPNTPSIASPTSAFTSVSGLVQGVYVFQLSLNSGASIAQVTVTVQASGTPTNIFTTQALPTITQNDGPQGGITGIELGVKFRSTVSGQITGMRFYKTSGNTGTHIGELYAYPSGTRLAQATFSGESSSGWQMVTFSSPIIISPNTTYVAAYWSGSGNYSGNTHHFAIPITNGPLTGLADGTDGHNGIYKYTGSPAFPTTYTTMSDQPNYWVDVMFLPDNTPIPNAGNNLAVTLPVSSVTLNGGNSYGTLSNFLWTKVSGPNTPTIVSPNSLITNVTGLIAGTYVFQLAINGASNSAYALTGTKSYNLAGNTVSKSGLTNGKKYILSYWSRGSACSVSGASNSTSTGRSVNGWTYYQHTVTLTSTTLTVTGSSYIDELRLYPLGAQMSSYTYNPEVGITSMNDPNSEITFYEYDGLARLKNIKDYQGNIVKNFQYNYAPPPGPPVAGNYTVPMQTFAGLGTLSYPVGVFNLNYKLLGNAANQAQYISLWMSDTTDSHTGALSAGYDSMHFQIALYSGRTLPSAVLGMRYYQFDLAYNQLNGVTKFNCEYVDFGDNTKMYLGKYIQDTVNIVLAPNTTILPAGSGLQYGVFVHNYPDTSLKTITLYHNDSWELMYLRPSTDYFGLAITQTKLKNLRGYCPQYSSGLEIVSYQQNTALSMDSIKNWNSVNTGVFEMLAADTGKSICKNFGFKQDFMKSSTGLYGIQLLGVNFSSGYYDSTFKLSTLKSNWNTYFTNLQFLNLSDEMWNREDLSSLTKMYSFVIIHGNQNHSNSPVGNSPIPIPSSAIDAMINQIAAGAGQNISNGNILIFSGGPGRTSASDNAYNFLISKGWDVYLDPSY